MPKVSVIVPVYKVEAFIRRCADSLINQTLTDIEIILVDDGSPDNCPAICDEYARADNRIKVVHRQNGGLSAARNSGLAVAAGDYIAFVDSDDYVDLNLYELMYNAAAQNNCDMAVCGVKTVNQDGKVSPNQLSFDKAAYDGVLSQDRKKSLFFSYGTVCSKLVRRQLIADNNISFPEGLYFEDYYFGSLLSTYIGSVKVVENANYYYYINDTSITRKKDNDYQPHKLLIMERLTAKLKEICKYDYYYDELEYMYSCFCFMNMAKMCVSAYTKPNYPLLLEITRRIKTLYPNYKNNKYFKQKVSAKDRMMVEILNISPYLYVLAYKIAGMVRR